MSRNGRYGKYGEVKRSERLRRSRLRNVRPRGGRTPLSYGRKRGRAGTRRETGPFIRVGFPRDGVFIGALSRRVFQPYGDYAEVLKDWFDKRIAFTLIAVTPKGRSGFIMLGPLDPAGRLAPVAEILAVAVEPDCQSRGLGRRLLAEALVQAGGLGAETVMLHTAEQNEAARRLFESFGFVAAGLKRVFYPKGQDAVLMVKALQEAGTGPVP